jgi:AraC-like DNA-binding protein
VIPNYLSLSGDDVLDVEYIIVKMEEEYEKKEVDYVNALRNYLQLFIIKLMRSVKKQLSNNLNYQIRRAIEFIEANFSTIHPSDVSSFLSYNSSYFSKIFKEQTGVNISEYINRKRIKEAFRMIKDSNSTIEAISLAVGFKDKKHFNQMFKRYIGTTPNTIRKNK